MLSAAGRGWYYNGYDTIYDNGFNASPGGGMDYLPTDTMPKKQVVPTSKPLRAPLVASASVGSSVKSDTTQPANSKSTSPTALVIKDTSSSMAPILKDSGMVSKASPLIISPPSGKMATPDTSTIPKKPSSIKPDTVASIDTVSNPTAVQKSPESAPVPTSIDSMRRAKISSPPTVAPPASVLAVADTSLKAPALICQSPVDTQGIATPPIENPNTDSFADTTPPVLAPTAVVPSVADTTAPVIQPAVETLCIDSSQIIPPVGDGTITALDIPASLHVTTGFHVMASYVRVAIEHAAPDHSPLQSRTGAGRSGR